MSNKMFVVLALLFLVLPYLTAVADETDALKGGALPADGGEPGKVYMEYIKVFEKGDMQGLKKFVTEDRAKALDDPEMKEMFPMMQSMQPKEIKITGGMMNTNDAILNVTGKNADGSKADGTVHMVLKDKEWKIEKESWKSGTTQH
jgi:hypothetical protein